jgi:hypothetical protein
MEREQICKRLSGRNSKEKVVAYFKDYPGICLDGEKTQGEILGKKSKCGLPNRLHTKILIVIVVILDTCMGDVCYMV